MVFWLLFSNKSIQNILILSAIVAPFASAGIRPVVNRLNQDTTVYYGLVFCLFSWPYMVKWHNSGIIINSKRQVYCKGENWSRGTNLRLTLYVTWCLTSLTDLFSLYVLFSQYRSCDNTLENCVFQILSCSRAYVRKKTKCQVPLRPLLGKQNIQAKEVYTSQSSATRKPGGTQPFIYHFNRCKCTVF